MNGFRKWALLLSFSALVSAVAGELNVKPDQLEARYRAKVGMKDGAICCNASSLAVAGSV